MKHFRRLAVFHSSRRDTSKATPGAQSAIYCREYQLAQPDRHSWGRPPYLRANEEPIAKSLSYRTQTSNNSDGIEAFIFGRCSRASMISHHNASFALTCDIVGIQADVTRLGLAKLQLGSADGMSWSMVLPKHMISRYDKATSSETLQEITDAVRRVGPMRRVQILGLTSTSSRHRWGLRQLEDNKAIIACKA